MAKQPKLKTEGQPPISFFKHELSTMLVLFRNCQTTMQREMVLEFYRKYVNKKWRGTLSNCVGCGRSFLEKFKETRDWVSKNSHLFIN